MDYNMIHFFNFDKCMGNRIIYDVDDEIYTIIDNNIDLAIERVFANYFSSYSIQTILDYIDFNNYTKEYITHQMSIDLPRSMLYCNSELVTDVESFINYLEWKVDDALYKEVGTFCSQIVFAYPITNIQLKLNEKFGDFYICELSSKSTDSYKTHLSLYTIDDKTVYNIDICKKLRLCKIPIDGEPKTVYNFSLIIRISEGFYNVDIVID